jgi:hypothetical protein
MADVSILSKAAAVQMILTNLIGHVNASTQDEIFGFLGGTYDELSNAEQRRVDGAIDQVTKMLQGKAALAERHASGRRVRS